MNKKLLVFLGLALLLASCLGQEDQQQTQNGEQTPTEGQPVEGEQQPTQEQQPTEGGNVTQGEQQTQEGGTQQEQQPAEGEQQQTPQEGTGQEQIPSEQQPTQQEILMGSLDQTMFPEFIIELTDDANMRFNEVNLFFKDLLVEHYNSFDTFFSEEIRTDFETNFEELMKIDEDKYNEIKAVAADVGVEEWRVVLGNFMNYYDGKSVSVLASLEDGNVALESIYEFDSETIKSLIYKAHFYLGGAPWYEAYMVAGEVGVRHGIWNESFSISSHRRHIEAELMNLKNLTEDGFRNPTWLVRDLLEMCFSYDCGVSGLAVQKIAFDSYFLLNGYLEYNGFSYSRNRYTADNIIMLSEDRWYLVQTNEDHYDGICGEQCMAAKQYLDELDKSTLTKEMIMDEVLLKGPIFNENSKSLVAMVTNLGSLEGYAVVQSQQ